MTARKDIAEFFQLGLRLGLIERHTIEQWVDSVIAAETTVSFPFTELAGASHLSSAIVDELLGEVPGAATPYRAGHVILALVRRRFLDGALTPEATIKVIQNVSVAASLNNLEQYRADALDDALYLATSGIHGSNEEVEKGIEKFLENYSCFDGEIPILRERK